MTQYWDNVVKTFEALSYIVKETDKDGLDLHFTISGTTMKGEKTTRDLVSSVKAHIRRDGAASDIRLRLTSILESYSQKLEEKKRLWKRAPKPLSLYILTDGVWEESSSAEEPITNVVRILHELRKSSTQIGIQLISFGTDEASLAKLRYLDDKLDLPKCVYLSSK
jgi:hypothetical protein